MRKKTICIIPARSGSKRIPLKNIKKINNIHLIGHVIKNLKSSRIFKDIFVSTDSNKIKTISEKYGAKVPFLRNKRLSDDKTPVIKVIEDAIKRIEVNYEFDNICYIYPTSIFVKKKYIIKMYKKFSKSKADHFMVIKKFDHPIDRALFFNNNKIYPINSKKFITGTQKFKNYFYDTGQIYFSKKYSIINKKKLFQSKVECYLEKKDVIDIDDYNDFLRAKKKFRNEKK
tara:strand:+ start:40629 stop:41315 length:687 start_codon:yes stop_codon:yes gene_type:complete